MTPAETLKKGEIFPTVLRNRTNKSNKLVHTAIRLVRLARRAELTNKMGLYPMMTVQLIGFLSPASSRYCWYWLAAV